jgi:hypothetical protein
MQQQRLPHQRRVARVQVPRCNRDKEEGRHPLRKAGSALHSGEPNLVSKLRQSVCRSEPRGHAMVQLCQEDGLLLRPPVGPDAVHQGIGSRGACDFGRGNDTVSSLGYMHHQGLGTDRGERVINTP